MRWVVVAIVGYICLVAETTLFRPGALAIEVDGHWARPDLVLMLGVFLALHFEPHEVFVAGWCLGLASGLVSMAGRLGVQALLFGSVLYVIACVRGGVFRRRVLTQLLVCFAAVLVVHWSWYVATRFVMGVPLLAARSAEEAVLDAVYSAVLAPYLFWLLLRLRGPLYLPAGSLAR